MNDLKSLPNPVLNHATLIAMLGNYARPNDKIRNLIAKQELLPLKRGLYLTANLNQSYYELIANHLYGPSYVSRHWALAYYGLISERVSVVTSMCIGRSRQINTSQGLFHYQAIPASYYSVGITSIQQSNIAFMMATPEKALADLLVSTQYLRIQSQAAMLEYLENDLRMDVDDLATLDISKLHSYADKDYKSSMLRQLIKAIRSLSYD